MSGSLLFAIYCAGFLVTLPLMGRRIAKQWNQNPGHHDEPTPSFQALICAIVWPITLVFQILTRVLPKMAPVVRKMVTGQEKKFVRSNHGY